MGRDLESVACNPTNTYVRASRTRGPTSGWHRCHSILYAGCDGGSWSLLRNKARMALDWIGSYQASFHHHRFAVCGQERKALQSVPFTDRSVLAWPLRRTQLFLCFSNLIIVDSGLIIALATISLSFTMDGRQGSTVAITGLALFLASYGVGLGPVAWLLPSEIFATSIRAKGVSLATFLNRGVATLMVCSFLTIHETITWPLFFMMLAGFCLVTLILLYFYLPETKGRSLEDMSLYFAEETGDFSILDAERRLRVESELEHMKDGNLTKPNSRMDTTERTFTGSVTSSARD
jgi:Sugar (and other) transporter